MEREDSSASYEFTECVPDFNEYGAAVQAVVGSAKGSQATAATLKAHLSHLYNAMLHCAVPEGTVIDADSAVQRIAEWTYTEFQSSVKLSGWDARSAFTTARAVDELGKTMVRRTCDLVDVLLMLIEPQLKARKLIPLPGFGCEAMLQSVTLPVLRALDRAALGEDITTASTTALSRVRQAISELATVQETIETHDTVTFDRPVMGFRSRASLEMKTVGTVKAGFDLSKGYSARLTDNRSTLLVTLPAARVLSRDVFSTVIRSKNGVFIEIGPEQLNSARINVAHQIMRQAVEGGILTAAEARAHQVLSNLLAPVLYHPLRPLKLVVKVGEQPPRMLQ